MLKKKAFLFQKDTLDRFYKEYDFKERLKHDPIEFPRRYSHPEDIEVAAFIASCFAYGKVELFKPVIEKILKPGGRHPAKFFTGLVPKKDEKYFRGISYRFNKEKDIFCLIYLLSKTLQKWGSLKNLFYNYYRPDDNDIKNALNGFVDYFLQMDTSLIYKTNLPSPPFNSPLNKGGHRGAKEVTGRFISGKNIKPYGLTQLLPSPEKGGACKRLNLFLRWMVRNKDIDLGIWDKIPPSKLIIPLDIHIAKISRCLGLTERTSSDWKTAKEITESLKKLDPEDPLKYDFALCHYGISGLCKGRRISLSPKGSNRMVHIKGKKSSTICTTCVFYPH